jgi:ligand-binding sensor domain-containing protein
VPEPAASSPENGPVSTLTLPEGVWLRQVAVSPKGVLHAATSRGLLTPEGTNWQPVRIEDEGGRAWAVGEVPGVAFDSMGRLWFATKAGVGCQTPEGWRFYEGKDGLPWNDFTGMAAGVDGEVWFATRLGVIRFDGANWHYRQGPRWLPHDHVVQLAVDEKARPGAARPRASDVSSGVP